MTASDNPQETVQVLDQATCCPQCPEGGYDLIHGSRRKFLLEIMQDALDKFQENGGVDELLDALQQVILNGLDPSDLDQTVAISEKTEGLAIDCREISRESDDPRLEITVVECGRKYSVEVLRSQIIPLKTFEISGCPLVDEEAPPGCDPETCPTIRKTKAKTTRRP